MTKKDLASKQRVLAYRKNVSQPMRNTLISKLQSFPNNLKT